MPGLLRNSNPGMPAARPPAGSTQANHHAGEPVGCPPRNDSRNQPCRHIDAMPGVPAIVLNGRLDVLGANALGRALFPSLDAAGDQPNNARIVFLDPQSTTFFREWDKVANDTVVLLRAEAGRDPYDKELSDLIGELSTRSGNFRVRWAAADPETGPQNVGWRGVGGPGSCHELVGDRGAVSAATGLAPGRTRDTDN